MSLAYLDHAATSPVRPEVAEAYAKDLVDFSGLGTNPASTHSSGRRAAGALFEARERVAALLGASAHEVIFTSGGSEADALAVSGFAFDAAQRGQGCALLVSAVEHPAVLDSAQRAQNFGSTTRLLAVDAQGRVDLEALAQTLQQVSVDDALLVSVMLANNETGVIEPLNEIAQLLASQAAHRAEVIEQRAANGGRAKRVGSAAVAALSPQNRPWLHTDATAAVGKMRVDMGQLQVDALSLSGHKLGAPVGIGALVANRSMPLKSPYGGGGQERGLRSGTQDVAGARALALAMELAEAEREAKTAQWHLWQQQLLDCARAAGGTVSANSAPTISSTAHAWFSGVDSEALLMALDMAQVAASAGSACHAGVAGASHVLEAMGVDDDGASCGLRFSFGWSTTQAQIDAAQAALGGAIEVARRAWATKNRSKLNYL